MAHLLANARRLLTNRRMLPAYLAWSASRSFRRPPRLHLPCGGCLTEFRDFSEYWSNRDMIPTRGEQLLLWTYLRPGGVTLDIGANIGRFSVTMGRLCDSASIFSFEPAQGTYKRLLRNLQRNALANVVAERRAMGKQAGLVRLAIDPKSSALSRIALDHEGEVRGRTFEVVPCTTLDDFCAERGIEPWISPSSTSKGRNPRSSPAPPGCWDVGRSDVSWSRSARGTLRRWVPTPESWLVWSTPSITASMRAETAERRIRS